MIQLSHSCITNGKNISSDQSLSRVWLFVTPWTAARQASLSITTPRVYSHSRPLSQWCHPTISPFVIPFSSHLQSFPALWSFFSFSISPSNEYSGLISFRMDWLNLLAVQGTLKSLLQHHSSKASILCHMWHSILKNKSKGQIQNIIYCFVLKEK